MLAHFDRLSEAPGAVPRLRRFILDLAVRGKLVAQDAGDEPAAILIDQIEAEKGRLMRAGLAGKQEAFESKLDADTPFPIPNAWVWVPATFPAYMVSDLGKKVQTKDVLQSGEFPVVDQGKVFIRGYCNDQDKVIRVVAPLILFGDHTRETKLIDFDFVVGADGVKLLQPVCLFTRYYFLSLQWLPLDSRGYGRHFKLLKSACIPLPPLAEQHRIVVKVDELMALCDQLEAAQQERERRRDRLASASLQRLNQPAADIISETQREHARFHLHHLPRLTTRPEHIKAMRAGIRALAVRGKLVPQDQGDESVNMLLSRIDTERALLVQMGRIRKEKILPGIPETEWPFEIPLSWSWQQIGSAALFTEYGTSEQSSHTELGVPVLKMGDIQDGKLVLGGQKKVSTSIDDLPTLYLEKFDLLYNRTNSAELVGKTGIYLGEDNDYTFASYLIRIRVSKQWASPAYFNLAMNAPYFRSTQINPHLKQQCGQANVNGTNLKSMLIPLPPLAEQHRIVAKVDALMALCDQLEAQLSTTQTDSRRLLEAVLEAAPAPV